MSGVTLGICRKELNALHVALRFAAVACGEERERGDCVLAPSTLDDTLAPSMLDDTFAAIFRELASACLRTAAAESTRSWRAFSSATTAWYSADVAVQALTPLPKPKWARMNAGLPHQRISLALA
jgi:hypothetical protein